MLGHIRSRLRPQTYISVCKLYIALFGTKRDKCVFSQKYDFMTKVINLVKKWKFLCEYSRNKFPNYVFSTNLVTLSPADPSMLPSKEAETSNFVATGSGAWDPAHSYPGVRWRRGRSKHPGRRRWTWRTTPSAGQRSLTSSGSSWNVPCKAWVRAS
jgi:hypothetical protein